MRFELIDTAPRLTARFRIALALGLDEYTNIALRQQQQFQAQWPLVSQAGAVGCRLREHFDGLVAASAMSIWAETRRWSFPHSDLDYLRAQQARARRRFLRALRRIARRQSGAPLTSAPTNPLALPASVVSPFDAAEADEAPLVLSLPGYTERPAQRWLELFELLNQLPPGERPSRGLFAAHGGQSLWGWACGQAGLFPQHSPRPWHKFVSGMVTGTVARMLPTWVGMAGCAPVDARTLEIALVRIGMAAAIDELDAAWYDALSRGAKTVPFTPFTWVPANVSWYGFLEEIEKTTVPLAPAEWQSR